MDLTATRASKAIRSVAQLLPKSFERQCIKEKSFANIYRALTQWMKIMMIAMIIIIINHRF